MAFRVFTTPSVLVCEQQSCVEPKHTPRVFPRPKRTLRRLRRRGGQRWRKAGPEFSDIFMSPAWVEGKGRKSRLCVYERYKILSLKRLSRKALGK